MKDFYLKMVAAVKEKLAGLPEGSHIRRALPNSRLKAIVQRITAVSDKDLEWAYWEPLLLFIEAHSPSQLKVFESAINTVVNHSNSKQRHNVTSFLKATANPKDDRLWASGMFEIFVKSRLLQKKTLNIELDYALPNRRNVDARIKMGVGSFYLECTVITESDEDKKAWDRFIADKKLNPNEVLIRPGRFDSPGSSSPSPYYDCLRFYAKVYDKLALDLNPLKSQMSQDNPNVLLISFYSPRAPLSPTSHGVGWALDELLADQPASGARLKDHPPGVTDISFLAWLFFRANELHSESRLDLNRFQQDFSQLVAAPRKVGAILLFEGCSLRVSRVNYNANKASSVSHRGIVELEDLLHAPPEWDS